MKILIIDDSPELRFILRYSLSRLGKMEVIEASGGREGVEKARAEKPDAILLDLVMPEMDGAMTLAALKNDETTAAIPVILLTAASTDFGSLRALGACGVLAKPFNPLALPGAVRAALEAA